MAPKKLEKNFIGEYTRKIIGVPGKLRIVCNPFLLWKS
jgi:hypothetical protein